MLPAVMRNLFWFAIIAGFVIAILPNPTSGSGERRNSATAGLSATLPIRPLPTSPPTKPPPTVPQDDSSGDEPCSHKKTPAPVTAEVEMEPELTDGTEDEIEENDDDHDGEEGEDGGDREPTDGTEMEMEEGLNVAVSSQNPASGIANLTNGYPYSPVKPNNVRCWTEWFDRDNPWPWYWGNGDSETLIQLRNENPGKICDNPTAIEVTTTSGISASLTGEVFAAMDTLTGFICKNEEQPDCRCRDYRVRFNCHPPFCGVCIKWTRWFDIDNPSGTGDWELVSGLRRRYPREFCDCIVYIEAVTVDTNTPAMATGDVFYAYNPTVGFVCRNRDQRCRDRRCRDYKVRFGCPCHC